MGAARPAKHQTTRRNDPQNHDFNFSAVKTWNYVCEAFSDDTNIWRDEKENNLGF